MNTNNKINLKNNFNNTVDRRVTALIEEITYDANNGTTKLSYELDFRPANYKEGEGLTVAYGEYLVGLIRPKLESAIDKNSFMLFYGNRVITTLSGPEMYIFNGIITCAVKID